MRPSLVFATLLGTALLGLAGTASASTITYVGENEGTRIDNRVELISALKIDSNYYDVRFHYDLNLGQINSLLPTTYFPTPPVLITFSDAPPVTPTATTALNAVVAFLNSLLLPSDVVSVEQLDVPYFASFGTGQANSMQSKRSVTTVAGNDVFTWGTPSGSIDLTTGVSSPESAFLTFAQVPAPIPSGPASVPEPTSLALLGTALGLGLVRQARRKRQAK